MSFQRLLCLFGIHKYETISSYEAQRTNRIGEHLGDGVVYHQKCKECQKMRRYELF